MIQIYSNHRSHQANITSGGPRCRSKKGTSWSTSSANLRIIAPVSCHPSNDHFLLWERYTCYICIHKCSGWDPQNGWFISMKNQWMRTGATTMTEDLTMTHMDLLCWISMKSILTDSTGSGIEIGFPSEIGCRQREVRSPCETNVPWTPWTPHVSWIVLPGKPKKQITLLFTCIWAWVKIRYSNNEMVHTKHILTFLVP